MANRSKGRRGRSRKRRPAPSSAGPASSGLRSTSTDRESADAGSIDKASTDTAHARGRGLTRRASDSPLRGRAMAKQGGGPSKAPLPVGERPRAPWHPLPLSELLILVGAIGVVVGLRRGLSHGGPPLFAGLAAVTIGTVEVTLREHLSGYRSHSLILALLPVIVLHSAVVLVVAAVTRVPQLLNVALLVVDLALFTFMFRLLRARFSDARRQRTQTGRR